MESITVNYWAVLVGGVLAMVIGMIWYGFLFKGLWLRVIKADALDLEARKKMEKTAGPLYLVQFVLVLFQVLVLSHLVADTTGVGGLERALWIWGAFVIPTLAGSVMWTTEPAKNKWARFLIQGGYQLVIFVVFGLLLQFWK